LTPNEDDFLANVHFVDDPSHRELTAEQLAALAPAESLLIVADRAAVTSPGKPLLVIHLTEQGTDELRLIAEELWSIENNISLGNMDWESFADSVDHDGVFRGRGAGF
jgi:hypothetical protein